MSDTPPETALSVSVDGSDVSVARGAAPAGAA
jgi:hypothetical protein